ncbi:protein DpdH [Candidatus Venteria ishoeyi]|uniref:Uncharacterized protein n=1 Tax=Candidatus Venteria ishoeyi TaxID=1899563 RepID=A0A1H6F8G6_9GAMM|nr:protein DpdH [Candidatus Venteria ishoeyi]SEH06418.1 Uncharacterised protein [Candidatus Venteria ishoeyi]
MAFQNFVCWKPEQALAVMNPDAEAVPEEIFLAVHTEYDLQVSAPAGSARKKITPKKFLKDFLSASRSHVQAVVLGESGSGKSHFIQWMYLNIPEQPNRKILRIPKAGTSLKHIVQKIIHELPEADRKIYQDELDQAGRHTFTPEGQRNRLLDQIAFAIGEDKPRQADNELEEFLLQNIPHLFHDPHFRNTYFLKKESIIEELVKHIFADPKTYTPIDKRREFTRDDLPLTGKDYERAAALTRDLLDILLNEPDSLPLSLEIINRNLDDAVALTLNFSRDSLIDLMTELRKYLYTQEQNLVLLIEDFARLQGLDNALLQALITPAKQAGESLCELRWAMAVTSGYYQRTEDTVQTRMDFVVDMNLPATEEGFIGKAGIARFASRYLNAARVGANPLKDWHEAEKAKHDKENVPNKCDDCEHKTECHSGFGDIGGIGLYPFTQTALWNMLNRVDSHLEERFNPRVLMKSVLIKVLDTYELDLQQGRFPPQALLNELNISQAEYLPPQKQLQLRQAIPHDYDRLFTFLELWDGSGQLINLEQSIHEAFGLKMLEYVDSGTEKPISTDKKPDPPIQKEQLENPNIKTIRDWKSGSSMPQSLASKLRGWLYDAVEAVIAWDNIGLEKKYFAKKSSNTILDPFRPASFYFVRQETQKYNSLVLLEIPLNKDAAEFTKTAIALEGLIQFRSHKHWDFPGGMDALANLLNCLDQWAAEVVRQLKALPGNTDTWNPIYAAQELLVLGATLSGKLPSQWKTADLFNACFDIWPDSTNTVFQSSELKALYNKLHNKKDTLESAVRACHSGTKGGQKGKFLNPTPLLPLLDNLRRNNWMLSQVVPENLARLKDYQEIAKIYREVQTSLAQAVKIEHTSRLDWLEKVEAFIPPNTKHEKVVEILENLLDDIAHNGLSCYSQKPLREILEEFKEISFDDTLESILRLRKTDCATKFLPDYSELGNNAMEVTQRLLGLTDKLFSEASSELLVKRNDLNAQGGGVLLDNQRKITQALNDLDDYLTQLTG